MASFALSAVPFANFSGFPDFTTSALFGVFQEPLLSVIKESALEVLLLQEEVDVDSTLAELVKEEEEDDEEAEEELLRGLGVLLREHASPLSAAG